MQHVTHRARPHNQDAQRFGGISSGSFTKQIYI